MNNSKLSITPNIITPNMDIVNNIIIPDINIITIKSSRYVVIPIELSISKNLSMSLPRGRVVYKITTEGKILLASGKKGIKLIIDTSIPCEFEIDGQLYKSGLITCSVSVNDKINKNLSLADKIIIKKVYKYNQSDTQRPDGTNGTNGKYKIQLNLNISGSKRLLETEVELPFYLTNPNFKKRASIGSELSNLGGSIKSFTENEIIGEIEALLNSSE